MKFDVKHLWKTRKKWIIGISAGVAAAAVGCVFWYRAGHSNADPIYAVPFQYVGMTEYWGDSQESNGPVTTDKIQTVFLSDTQTVTEILVQQGDEVKKGDVLMTFDTTLSDLQLERKRLEVEKLKLQLEDEKAQLRNLNGMKPMVVPDTSDEPNDTGSGIKLSSIELFPRDSDVVNKATYDGRSADKALIYWVFDSTSINSDIFLAADAHAAKLQAANQSQPDAENPTTPGTDGEETWPSWPLPDWWPDKEEGEEGTEETQQPSTEESKEPEGEQQPSTEETQAPEGEQQPSTEETQAPEGEQQPSTEETQAPEGEQQPSNASEVTPEYLPDGSSFYVVIKTTAGNTTLGDKKVWQCLKVTKSAGSYSFQFADTLIPDYSMLSFGDDTQADTPEVDYGSGYTAAQLAQMRSDQQKKIKETELKIKMADAEYRIMQREVSDGKVYAESDGKVISLLTEEEAKQTKQPILKVSGGGGFYVEGFINELEKDKLKLGQEVTVNDWRSGMTYTGTVSSIGDFPTRDGYYNGNGNPNASYYPFKVFVDESADLQAGSYVSVAYSTAGSENGIYLENPFLRTEQGKSYVLVLGKDGKLEQRWVTTGKSLWGNYTEILDGLTAEDLIAFPYGKNVGPGAAAVEGDISDLYG